MRVCAPFLVMFAGACTAPSPSSPPTKPTPVQAEAIDVERPQPNASAQPEPDPEPEPEPEPSGPETLLAIEAEWDAEPGADAIALHDDGRIVAGSETGQANLPTSGGYFFGEQAKLEIVKLGDAKHERALVVAIPTADEEDPPNVYQLFVSDGGKLRKIWEATVGSYGVVPLAFAGDGSVAYLEDGWTACERAKFPKVVGLKTVVLRIGKDGMLTEVKRRATKEKQECGMLAACPFVYVLGEGEPMLQGEILRNLRGAARHDVQSLLLLPAEEGVLRIRIAEEKPEVTRIDAVAIVVDGVEVRPRACAGDREPRYCRADREYEVLREDDALELEFDVPRGAERIELRAAGYYSVPR